jgi:hypothetical protein
MAGRSDQVERVHRPEDSSWPPHLKKLRQAALQAVKTANAFPSSPGEPGDHNDLVTVMRAMADPRKTLAAYVAMVGATGTVAGRPPSDAERREADELFRGFEQAPLTDRERQAVQRLARKRQWNVINRSGKRGGSNAKI